MASPNQRRDASAPRRRVRGVARARHRPRRGDAAARGRRRRAVLDADTPRGRGHQRPAVRAPHPPKESRVHGHCHPHADPRHRRHDGDLHGGRRGDAAPLCLPRHESHRHGHGGDARGAADVDRVGELSGLARAEPGLRTPRHLSRHGCQSHRRGTAGAAHRQPRFLRRVQGGRPRSDRRPHLHRRRGSARRAAGRDRQRALVALPFRGRSGGCRKDHRAGRRDPHDCRSGAGRHALSDAHDRRVAAARALRADVSRGPWHAPGAFCNREAEAGRQRRAGRVGHGRDRQTARNAVSVVEHRPHRLGAALLRADRGEHPAGAARAVGSGRVRAAHRLRQPREPVARARRRASAGDCDSGGARRQPPPDLSADAD